jgi:hypothetical protein
MIMIDGIILLNSRESFGREKSWDCCEMGWRSNTQKGLGFGFWNGVREKEFALGWEWKRGVGTKERERKALKRHGIGLGKGVGWTDTARLKKSAACASLLYFLSKQKSIDTKKITTLHLHLYRLLFMCPGVGEVNLMQIP